MKRLQGNPGKRKLPADGEEATPDVLFELPEPPEWLGEYGVKEWRRVGPHLVKHKLLTEADVLMFASYCANVHMLVESVMDIKEHGHVIIGARGKTRNPALASFAAATTAMRALAGEFGMTPSSRARIKLPGDDGNSLADLMGDDGEDDIQ